MTVVRVVRRVCFVAVIGFAPHAVKAQAADSVPAPVAPVSPHYWRNLTLGAVSSIMLHEMGHIGVALAYGHNPTFGFDKLRPTIYSGINSHTEPHEQFLFSAAGLTVQNLLDEAILDIPHNRGSAFERGLLGGGIGTTLFYLTIGRTGSVSDVDFMARTHALNKLEITAIFGGVSALHTFRMWRDPHYANFFARPRDDGGLDVGLGFTVR
ncbi:MAG: hypothetical protein ABI442_08205 [Gemmatimonadaceae bacterium]